MKRNKTLVSLFLRFAGAGAIGTLMHYCVLVICVKLLQLSPVLGSSLGAVCGAVVNYLLAHFYVFKSDKKKLETFWKFSSIATMGVLINSSLMYLLVNPFGLNYIISQILTSSALLLYGFIVNAFWTFDISKNKK